MSERDKSISGIWGAIKTYPVLIQFEEICCGDDIEDDKVCDEMEKKYSPPPGVDTKCDCFVENLKVDAIGDKITDKGFLNVEIIFRLPKVRYINIDIYPSNSRTSVFTGIDSETPFEVQIIRQLHVYRYYYSIDIRQAIRAVIEKPHYEIRGWIEQGKGINETKTYTAPEVVSIEPPSKGHVSYVVLVPEYDVIIDVESNGIADVVIWDSYHYGPVCIEPLVKDLRRKILS
jgi:hypothetical protein